METFPKPIYRLGMEKLNLTQQNQSKEMYDKINTKKLKPGLVASYDIRPGNREGLIRFWCS